VTPVLRLYKKSSKHDKIAILVTAKRTEAASKKRDVARYKDYDYSQGKFKP
jgi:hypothetical protein